jgi:lipoprotein-releasing system ATP-binding protein
VFELLRDLVTLHGKSVVAVTHDRGLARQIQHRIQIDGRLVKS